MCKTAIETSALMAHSEAVNCVNWFWSLLLAAGLLAGCGRGDNAPPPPRSDRSGPEHAQPRLKTMKLWLGAEELLAELALQQTEWQSGMMFRTNMAESEAMLFVFPVPHRAAFWMKNTFVPLSAAYIDASGTVLEIHDLEPHNTNSVSASTDRVQFVLETTQGWFARHNVSTGAVARTERGTLAETFLPRQ
jgi:uncharacterized protein